MHQATTQKESAGGLNTTTADTNNATQTIALHARIKGAVICFASWLAVLLRGMARQHSDQERQFATLRAQFAMKVYTLYRTSPTDGAVSFYAERWGLPTLDAAQRFLTQIWRQS